MAADYVIDDVCCDRKVKNMYFLNRRLGQNFPAVYFFLHFYIKIHMTKNIQVVLNL